MKRALSGLLVLLLAAGESRPEPVDKELGVKAEMDWAGLGAHRVGVRTVVLVDKTRDDGYTEGGRTLVTEIWYPAADQPETADRQTFAGFFGEHREAAEKFVARVGEDLEAVDKRFKCIAARRAPMKKGKFPLLIFSHGNGGLRHQNTFQLDHLASHGYVIASPDHTGNAAVTPLPGRYLIYDGKGRGRSAKDRPRDVSFLIDRLLEANSDAEHWLSSRIESEQIGVLGHSFGGFTACRAATEDRRVKAILPMTVAAGDATKVPLMLMLGKRDRTMGEAGNAVARLYWMSAKGPKYLFEFPRGGHFTFTDMDAIKPDFGDGVGRDPKTGEEYVDIREAKRWIKAYGLAFFERHLRGSEAAARFLQQKPKTEELELRSEKPGA